MRTGFPVLSSQRYSEYRSSPKRFTDKNTRHKHISGKRRMYIKKSFFHGCFQFVARADLYNHIKQVMMVKQNFDKELKELHKCHMRSPKHGKFGLSRFWDYLNFNLYYSDILHDSNIFFLIP